jgi:hypothetical protein
MAGVPRFHTIIHHPSVPLSVAFPITGQRGAENSPEQFVHAGGARKAARLRDIRNRQNG